MRSSWSRAARRRALGGAAVAALGTVLLAAPIASAAESPTTTPDPATLTLPTSGNDPDLGILRGDHDVRFDHTTIIVCEFCQVAKGDIVNVGKVVVIKHDHDHKKHDDKHSK